MLENCRGAPRDPCIEDQHLSPDSGDGLRFADHRRDGHRIVRIELVETESAISGGVLILLADRFAADIDFDVAGLFRQLLMRRMATNKSIKRVQESDGEGATLPKAGSSQ